jgi:hypothetical protein
MLANQEKLPTFANEEVDELKSKLTAEMNKLIQLHFVENPFESKSIIFGAKIRVIEAALDVLSGKTDLSTFSEMITKNEEWKSATFGKSKLEKYVNEVIEAVSPHSTHTKSEDFEL